MDITGQSLRESETGGPSPSADDIDVQVGARIRQRRRELRMSQEALAQALGITRVQVFKYETGETRVSCGRLYDISSVLGRPVSWYFEHDDSISRPAPEDEIVREIEELARGIRNRQLQLQFLNLARAIAELDQTHNSAAQSSSD